MKDMHKCNYFSNIDSEGKAYFIGFLMADGSIVKVGSGKYTGIQLHLSTKDVEIIEEFKKEIDSDNEIKYTNTNSVRFTVYSENMVYDLARFGVVPKKSCKELLIHDDIPDELLRHTVRGLIDGDGWICISDTARGAKAAIGLCGSYDICDFFTRYMHEKLGLKYLKVSKVKGCNNYKVSYSSLAHCKKIIRHLYSNSHIGLTRKAYNAKEILEMR